MTRRLLALPLIAFAAFAMPASAQDTAGDKVRMVIVYGDDAVPPPQGDEIVVVAHLPESDRYRIPEVLRWSDDPANMAWARRVEKLEMIGKFGTNSCSPAGAGGFTGCTQQLIDAAYADKREGSALRFSELIAAARADRLSTIDAEAAETQARVEAIENEYIDRLKRESEAPLPGQTDSVPPSEAPSVMQPPRIP